MLIVRYKQIEYKMIKFVNVGMAWESQLANRLWQLFNDKLLDWFIAQCETAISKGINLSSISKKYLLPADLQQTYAEAKRILTLTDTMLSIANSSDQGWKVIQIDEKCSISVRNDKSIIELKSKGTVPIPIKHILYVAYLIKFYTQCLPFCKEAYDLKQPSKAEKIGFIRLSLPVPLIKDRSAILRGMGINRIQKNGTICVFADGINENKLYLQKNKINGSQLMQGKQLLDLKHFAVQMKCTSPNQTEFSGYAKMDHHIPFLPDGLIVFVAKQAAKYVFNNLLTKLLKFEETVWAKEVKYNFAQNAQYYGWINETVNRWMTDIQNKSK